MRPRCAGTASTATGGTTGSTSRYPHSRRVDPRAGSRHQLATVISRLSCTDLANRRSCASRSRVLVTASAPRTFPGGPPYCSTRAGSAEPRLSGCSPSWIRFRSCPVAGVYRGSCRTRRTACSRSSSRPTCDESSELTACPPPSGRSGASSEGLVPGRLPRHRVRAVRRDRRARRSGRSLPTPSVAWRDMTRDNAAATNGKLDLRFGYQLVSRAVRGRRAGRRRASTSAAGPAPPPLLPHLPCGGPDRARSGRFFAPIR